MKCTASHSDKNSSATPMRLHDARIGTNHQHLLSIHAHQTFDPESRWKSLCWLRLSKYRHFLCDKLGHFLNTHRRATKPNPHLVAVQVAALNTSLQFVCVLQWGSGSLFVTITTIFMLLFVQAVQLDNNATLDQNWFSWKEMSELFDYKTTIQRVSLCFTFKMDSIQNLQKYFSHRANKRTRVRWILHHKGSLKLRVINVAAKSDWLGKLQAKNNYYLKKKGRKKEI